MKPIEKLAIGLLYFNKGLPQFERALYGALEELRLSKLVNTVTFIERHGMAVDVARNQIVGKTLELEHDAVVWIDTDLIFPGDSLVRLVDMANAGHMVSAGLYRRALRDNPHILTERIPGHGWATLEELREHEDGGVTQVWMTAGGFSIVRAEVYQAMRDKVGMPWYCNWDFERGDQSYEDLYFFRRLPRLGVVPVVDPDLHAVHWSHHGPIPVTDDAPEMRYCV